MALGRLVALLAVLGSAPDFELAFPEEAAEEQVDATVAIEFEVLPTVINLESISFALESDEIIGAREPTVTEAQLHLLGEVSHTLDAEVHNLTLGIALLSPADAKRVRKRLTDPPLTVQDDLDGALPRPLATIGDEKAISDPIDAGQRMTADLSAELGAIELDPRELPVAVVTIEGYTLHLPSSRDISTILERGGAADNAALARWAGQEFDRADLDDSSRREVMAAVLGRFKRMRSPPGFGDFQRLHALDAVMGAFGGAEDLEPLLTLQRPISILHTNALLSYGGAVKEEGVLGIPVHGMRDLPSRSELVSAPERAMKALRPVALHRLLRLAYDPIDFRNPPVGGRLEVSKLQAQATELLAPLTPTNVHAAMATAGGRTTVEREVLQFYVEANHAQVVEPLVDWLAEHPNVGADLGAFAAANLGQVMLPVVLQRYVDPAEPGQRDPMRHLLHAMPAELVPRIAAHVHEVAPGLDAFGPEVPLAQLLDAFEGQQRAMRRQRADALLAALKHGGEDAAYLRQALRATERLAHLAPEEIEANAEMLIALHHEAALKLDAASPSERARALTQLSNLPWGEAKPAAKRTITLIRTKLELRRDDVDAAMQLLEGHEPHMGHEEIREAYAAILDDELRGALATGRLGTASKLLAKAEANVPEHIDVAALTNELWWKRNLLRVVFGAAFGFVFLGTTAWVGIKFGGPPFRRWRAARRGELSVLDDDDDDDDGLGEDDGLDADDRVDDHDDDDDLVEDVQDQQDAPTRIESAASDSIRASVAVVLGDNDDDGFFDDDDPFSCDDDDLLAS